MSAKSDVELVVAAAELAALSPHSWATFMRELKAYEDRGINLLLATEPDYISVAQGRAIERRSLYNLLASCKEEREKLKR